MTARRLAPAPGPAEERELVAAVLFGGGAAVEDLRAARLRSSDLDDEALRWIVRAAVAVYDAGRDVDPSTVAAELDSLNLLERVADAAEAPLVPARGELTLWLLSMEAPHACGVYARAVALAERGRARRAAAGLRGVAAEIEARALVLRADAEAAGLAVSRA